MNTASIGSAGQTAATAAESPTHGRTRSATPQKPTLRRNFASVRWCGAMPSHGGPPRCGSTHTSSPPPRRVSPPARKIAAPPSKVPTSTSVPPPGTHIPTP